MIKEQNEEEPQSIQENIAVYAVAALFSIILLFFLFKMAAFIIIKWAIIAGIVYYVWKKSGIGKIFSKK